MNRARLTPPRWIRYALASLAALVVCLVWGVSTATADLSLGPHEARYEVSTDAMVVVDLGPLGSLEIDSPLPANLGAHVTVSEIPADLTAVGQADTLEALSRDLDGYLQFFSGPQETVEHVGRALVTDALQRTGLALGVVLLTGAGVYVLLGRPRRGELARVLAPRTWEITAAVVLVALVVGSLSSSSAGVPQQVSRPTSPVFAGTPLDGARITGRLAGVVDTYGGQLVGLYQENTDFYDQADANLAAAWDRRASIQRLTAPSEPPEASTDEPTDEAESQTGESTGDVAQAPAAEVGETDESAEEDAAQEEPAPEETPQPRTPEDELVTLLLISDLHCNTGMTPLIRTVAERSGASILLNGGDTTVNGTAVESFCVNSFASAVPSGATMVVADGNHDSQVTSDQERSAGVRVLDGTILELEGVRILGDRDALETRVGSGSRVAREETPTEQAERLAETACDASDPADILLVHTPRAGDETLASGCVPVQISGHTHRRAGPERVGSGVLYISASTAGAAANQPTVGPLRGTAEMTVLRFDPLERRIVDWQLVEIDPDGSARVGPRLGFPPPLEPGASTAETPADGAEEPAGDAELPADEEAPASDDGSPEPAGDEGNEGNEGNEGSEGVESDEGDG
ncbi:metallophosphoesterase family protein [Oerskovia flava]|uniref:metallophosphoesterase family protein n=1 Tax=Oerskovia flava TaxID=2986422 RepID=UPI002240D53E|nr:metallophosphoesterase [Oerskovia sp. JB1-3-2]